MIRNYLHRFLLLGCLTQFATADVLIGIFTEQTPIAGFSDMPSTFGNGLPYEGLEAMVVFAEPSDACKPIQGPPLDSNPTGKWVVVIARSNCTFDYKVRMAQNASYDAVIVHNVHSDVLEPMSSKNSSGIHIPSVFISETDGLYMKQLMTTITYYVIITPDVPFNINTHLLLPFAIVVGICFLVMIIFMIVKCIKDRRRQRRHRLPPNTLNKIPIHKFVRGDPYETCAICLDDYLDGEKLRVLPCAHAYHSKCIDPWLTKNRRVCPVCKRRVFAQDETSCSSDSDTDDDTTPLVNPSNQGVRSGGTFSTPSPLDRAVIQRLLRSVSQISEGVNIVTVSDHHSINYESSSDEGPPEAPPNDSRPVEVYISPGTSDSSYKTDTSSDV